MKRLVFSRDGKHLYVGGHGGLLMEFDVATCQETQRFVGHVGAVLGIAVSPDGRQLVSGDNSSGQVVIWDVATGQQFLTLATDGAPIVSLDWSSDGRRIVAGKEDGTIQVWTLRSLDAHITGPNVVMNCSVSSLAWPTLCHPNRWQCRASLRAARPHLLQ